MRVQKERQFAGTGRWKSTLTAIAEVDGSFGRKAMQFMWITDDGCQVRQVVGLVAAEGTSLGTLIDQLAGRRVLVGESVDLDDFIDRRYEIVIVKSGDMTKIASVKLLADGDAGFDKEDAA